MEFLVFIFGFLSGWMALRFWANIRIARMMDQLEDIAIKEDKNLKEHKNPNEVPIVLEKNNGIIYAYEEGNMMFLGQGNSPEDIKNVLENLYPDKSFTATAKNIKEVFYD